MRSLDTDFVIKFVDFKKGELERRVVELIKKIGGMSGENISA